MTEKNKNPVGFLEDKQGNKSTKLVMQVTGASLFALLLSTSIIYSLFHPNDQFPATATFLNIFLTAVLVICGYTTSENITSIIKDKFIKKPEEPDEQINK